MPTKPSRWGKELAPERDFSADDLFTNFGSETFQDDFDIAAQVTITARKIRRPANERTLLMMNQEHLRDRMKKPPAKGTAYHIVSNAKADFFTWIPHLIDLIGHADEAFFSTWTISRPNVRDLLDLFDRGKLKKLSVMSGLYFKAREGSVYAELLDGLLKRGQRFVCLENHAKVALLANRKAGHYITVEGSANFTSNPRVEQCCLVNCKNLYAFHASWMSEALRRPARQSP